MKGINNIAYSTNIYNDLPFNDLKHEYRKTIIERDEVHNKWLAKTDSKRKQLLEDFKKRLDNKLSRIEHALLNIFKIYNIEHLSITDGITQLERK